MKESSESPKMEAQSHNLPFLKKAVAAKVSKGKSKSSMRGKAGK